MGLVLTILGNAMMLFGGWIIGSDMSDRKKGEIHFIQFGSLRIPMWAIAIVVILVGYAFIWFAPAR